MNIEQLEEFITRGQKAQADVDCIIDENKEKPEEINNE